MYGHATTPQQVAALRNHGFSPHSSTRNRDLGSELARLGLAEQVFDKSETTELDDHSRATLLAALIPLAPEMRARLIERMNRIKRREWALDAFSYQVGSLSSEQRTTYVEEALAWIATRPDRSYLISRIGQRMASDDPDAHKLLAAARNLEPGDRAERLVECAELVPEAQRKALVLEILRDARELEHKHKQRLLSQLARMIRTDKELLMATLEFSRQLSDDYLIASTVEECVVRLAAMNGGNQALCANVLETADPVVITVEGQLGFCHDAEHVREEVRRCRSARRHGVRGPGGCPLGRSGESHLARASEA